VYRVLKRRQEGSDVLPIGTPIKRWALGAA